MDIDLLAVKVLVWETNISGLKFDSQQKNLRLSNYHIAGIIDKVFNLAIR